jgi:hypothetical protein
MATMTTRRLRRQARRKLGEMVENVSRVLAQLAEEAEELGDQEIVDCCGEAFFELQETLTPDGLPTVTTLDVLPDIITGPLSRATQRLRPGFSPPTIVESVA